MNSITEIKLFFSAPTPRRLIVMGRNGEETFPRGPPPIVEDESRKNS